MNQSRSADVASSAFVPPAPLDTAVLFVIFNRPEVTTRVFAAIREARPPRLYIAADGPRANRPGEDVRCRQARAIIDLVDWPCELHTLLRERNLGCKLGVSTAITWFFEHESQGIILEDDCLPVQSFFWYCEAMLARYANDSRIGHISGTRFFADRQRDPQSSTCGYSRYGFVWGWATWRRAWQHFDASLRAWPQMIDERWWNAAYPDPRERRAMRAIGQRVHDGKIDAWGYQWSFARSFQSQLSVMPPANLIVNLGFDADATHTTYRHPDAPITAVDLRFPLASPPFVLADRVHDRAFARHTFSRIRSRLRLLVARLADPDYLRRKLRLR